MTNMQKTFLKHSLVYSVVIFFNRGISFLMIPLMTRYMHPADYGVFDLVVLSAAFATILCGLELHQGMSRFLNDKTENLDKPTIISSVLLYLSIAYIVLITICNFLDRYINYNATHVNINLVLLYFYFQSLVYYISVFLRFDLKPKLNLYLNAFTAFSVTATTILFVVVLHLGLYGALLSLFLGNLLGTIVAIYLIRHSFVAIFNFKVIKLLLTYSLPLVFSSLAVYLMMYTDRIMLNKFLDIKSVGIFGIGYRFASIIAILMIGVQSSLTPLIYNSMSNDNFKYDLAKLFNRFLILGTLSLIIMQLAAYPLIRFMVSSDYYESVSTFRNMSIAIFFSQLYVFTPGMQINKKSINILSVNLFGVVLNIILCYFFIQLYGVNGSSFASMVSYIVFFIVYLLYSQREIFISFNYKLIIFCIVLLVIVNRVVDVLW